MNKDDAEKFLAALDPTAERWTFQTFDDDRDRKNEKLTHIIHGSLSECWAELVNLNDQGAGIFVTVNETDFKGRATDNIVRIRSLFVDLDGAPLEPVLANGRKPHVVVESSKDRWHAYWLVTDFPKDKDRFRDSQKALIEAFDSDPAIHDLPRVMRLPGFTHSTTKKGIKTQPFLSRVVSIREGDPYGPTDFLPLVDDREQRKPLPQWLRDLCKEHVGCGVSTDPSDLPDPVDAKKIKAAVAAVDPYINNQTRFEIGCALYTELGDELGFKVWDLWSFDESEKYKPDFMISKWKSIVEGNYAYTAGTIFHYADEADPGWRRRYDDRRDDSKGGGTRGIILTNAEFVGSYVPPDYLFDGLMVRHNLFGLTGPTNAGKTAIALLMSALVVTGRWLGNMEVVQGKVLFLSGENPDDARMRWIKLCEEMAIPKEDADNIYWIPGRFSLKNTYKQVEDEAAKHGPFNLVCIDSAAAFYEGDDENSNAQFGRYAAVELRAMTEVNGRPSVLVLCHPVKNCNIDCLQPRGGGAFVAELDSNLVVVPKSETPKVSELHWHVKHRGVDFAPIPFKITPGTSEQIKDSKGRLIWTVTAQPMTRQEAEAADDIGNKRQDELLLAMLGNPRATLEALARACGWFYKSGEPNKSMANRTMKDLEAQRLVTCEAHCWELTAKGKKAAEAAKVKKASEPF
jgi:hypothetical protein